MSNVVDLDSRRARALLVDHLVATEGIDRAFHAIGRRDDGDGA